MIHRRYFLIGIIFFLIFQSSIYPVSANRLFPLQIEENIQFIKPPKPPVLSNDLLDSFMKNHTKYQGGSTADFRPVFKKFCRLLGGDIFINKLLTKYPNTILNITSQYNGVAASSRGNTIYSKSFWDSNPNRRVAVLIHEYIHHLDNGNSSIDYYRDAQANPSLQWDDYAMTSPAEYIACGVEWVVTNDMYDLNETKRQRLFRIDPNFYNYLVQDFIPNKLYK